MSEIVQEDLQDYNTKACATRRILMNDNIKETLKERGSNYGSFDTHSILSQGMKDVARTSEGWHKLPPYQKEAIELIFHKIARICNGVDGGYYVDNFTDIVGYGTLVLNHLSNLDGDVDES
jgi:hypothetical protein